MKNIECPYMNLRDCVLFPGMTLAIMVGREFTIKAIERAKKEGGNLLIFSQKDGAEHNPADISQMYTMGSLCKVIQSVKFTDGSMKVLLEGKAPAKLLNIEENEGVRYAKAEVLKQESLNKKVDLNEKDQIIDLLCRWNPKLIRDWRPTYAEDFDFDKYLREESNESKFIIKTLRLLSHPHLNPRRAIYAQSI